jgi:hypothetical protein
MVAQPSVEKYGVLDVAMIETRCRDVSGNCYMLATLSACCSSCDSVCVVLGRWLSQTMAKNVFKFGF